MVMKRESTSTLTSLSGQFFYGDANRTEPTDNEKKNEQDVTMATLVFFSVVHCRVYFFFYGGAREESFFTYFPYVAAIVPKYFIGIVNCILYPIF